MTSNPDNPGRSAVRSRSLADTLNEPSNDSMEVDEQDAGVDASGIKFNDDDTIDEVLAKIDRCRQPQPQQVDLVPKSSFEVLHEGLPPLQGQVFQASWKGEPMENGSDLVNALAAPIFGEVLNRGQKRPSPDAGSDDATPSIRCHIKRQPGGPPGDSGPPNKLTFRDCGGLEKQVRTALLDPLSGKDGDKAHVKRFGLQAPKGILFYGPPGTGKTRLAQALSNELKKVLNHKVHFIYRKGQDVASKYFGQSEVNLREVFEEATRMQPTVIFFDELDGLCPSRDGSRAHQVTISIVTTMLGLMDELPKGKVFVIGATNRLETVDPALRRPGRFDKHLEFLPPAEKGRFDILKIHTKDWKVKPVEHLIHGLSQETIGFSGADLAKLCMDTFDNALSRILNESNGNFNSPTLKNLSVEDRDWRVALGKMKPSNPAIFGSSLYTPSAHAGDHATLLLESDVTNIVEAVTNLLPSKKSLHAHSSIMSLHVSSGSEAVLGNLDEYVISETLRSQELGKYTMYTISPATLSSLPRNKWSNKIHEAFTQALDSSEPSILYLQQTDELWNMLKDAKLGFALNLKQEVERLRGKFVLLLTSGPHPATLPPDNPLKKVLVGSARIFEVLPPSEDERYNFFESAFADAVNCTTEKWTGAQLIKLDLALEKAVGFTEGKELGSMLCLHDQLKEFLVTAGTTPANDVLKRMMEIIGHYGMKYPPPIQMDSDSDGEN